MCVSDLLGPQKKETAQLRRLLRNCSSWIFAHCDNGYIFLFFQGLTPSPSVLLFDLPLRWSFRSFSCLSRGLQGPRDRVSYCGRRCLFYPTLLAVHILFPVTDFWTPAGVYEIPNFPPPAPCRRFSVRDLPLHHHRHPHHLPVRSCIHNPLSLDHWYSVLFLFLFLFLLCWFEIIKKIYPDQCGSDASSLSSKHPNSYFTSEKVRRRGSESFGALEWGPLEVTRRRTPVCFPLSSLIAWVTGSE